MKRGDETKAELWRGLLTSRVASGLSVRAFCQREGIAEPQFYYWQRRLAGKVLRANEPSAEAQPLPAPEFVELVLATDPAGGSAGSASSRIGACEAQARAMEVQFRCGAVLCIYERLEIHHTPVHGSWLNMAEIELSVLSRQCLKRRIPTHDQMKEEVEQWCRARNAVPSAVNWRFTSEDARINLRKLYPTI